MSSTSRSGQEGSRSDRLVDVELLDETTGAPGDGGEVAPRPSAPSDRGALPLVGRRWWPVAIALAVALAATSVVADRRDAARLASLADVSGVVSPLSGPPRAEWSTTAGVWSTPIETAGRIVYATGRADRGTDVIAYDAVTGAQDWRTRLGAPTSDTSASLTSTCMAVTAKSEPVRHLVACLAGLFMFGGPGGGTANVTVASTHMELIDAVSGEIVEDTPTAPATAIGQIGTDLVRAVLTADGHLRVERTDPLSAIPRWTFTSPAPWTDIDASNLRISVVADRILVLGGATLWSVLSADGTPIRTSDQVMGSGRVTGFTGRRLFTESSSAVGSLRTEVLDLGAGTSFTIAGYPAGPSPDDRSLPDLILSETGDALVASDAATGTDRWSTPVGKDGQVMVMDGQVVVDDPSSLRAIDGRSGTVLWERRGVGSVDHSAVTDGTVVVCLTTKPDGTADMTAYGLADGVPRWTITVPSPAQTLTTIGRRLVTAAAGRTTVWG